MTPDPDETTMTPCERTAELLPWLLNDTLDAATASSLRDHLASCGPCRADAERAREALAVAAAHPPAEALVAFAWDEGPEDAARVAAHLTTCASCSEELALVRAGRRLSGEPATIPNPAAAGGMAWRWAAVAAALLALVGFVGWGWTVSRHVAEAPAAARRVQGLEGALRQRDLVAGTLRQDLDRSEERRRVLESEVGALRSPVLNANVVEVYPDVVLRGEEQTANDIAVARDDAAVTLLLTATAGTRPGSHRVELVAPSGEVLWRAEGLELQPTGDFALTVPATLLPDGRVTVRLVPLTGGGRGGRTEATRYVLIVRRRE